MNPMISDAIGSVLRFGLAGAAGYMVSKGIWTEVEAATYLTAVVAGLVALGWSLYAKYVSRSKLVTALATPAGKSEAQIEELSKLPSRPPVSLDRNAEARLM